MADLGSACHINRYRLRQGCTAGAVQACAVPIYRPGGATKAGQVQTIPAHAQKLATTARQIPALFPAGSVNPAISRAKPEIWQKWAEFEFQRFEAIMKRNTALARLSRAVGAPLTKP